MPSLASTEPLYERSSPTIKFSFAISSPNHFGKSATIACRDADYVKRIANLPDTQEQLVSYVYKEAVSPPAKKATALGSINACVLTVEYARSCGLDVRGLIVNCYSSSGNLEMEDDNIRMMLDLTGLEILAKVKDGDTDLGVQPF